MFSQTKRLIGKTVILFEICTETNTVMLSNVLKTIAKKRLSISVLTMVSSAFGGCNSKQNVRKGHVKACVIRGAAHGPSIKERASN